jgi:HK97 family phage major capsid protein
METPEKSVDLTEALKPLVAGMSAEFDKKIEDLKKTLTPAAPVETEEQRMKKIVDAEVALQVAALLAKPEVVKNFMVNTHIESKKSSSDPVDDYLRFLAARVRIHKTGGNSQEFRIVSEFNEKESKRLTFAGQQVEGTAADGGNLVVPEFNTALMAVTGKYGLFTNLVSMPTINTNELDIHGLLVAPTAAWTPEVAASTASKATNERKTLSIKKLMSEVTLSNEILQDAPQFRESIINLIGEAFAKALDAAWLNGPAVTTSTNPFTGLFNLTYANPSVTASSSSDPGLNYQDTVDCETQLAGFERTNAAYVMHPTSLGLARKVVDNMNRPLFQNDKGFHLGAPSAPIDTINGFPVYTSYSCPDIVTTPGANLPFIWFGHIARVTIARMRQEMIMELLTMGTDSAANNLNSTDSSTLRAKVRIGMLNYLINDIDATKVTANIIQTGP